VLKALGVFPHSAESAFDEYTLVPGAVATFQKRLRELALETARPKAASKLQTPKAMTEDSVTTTSGIGASCQWLSKMDQFEVLRLVE
jgi:hypothetical protein